GERVGYAAEEIEPDVAGRISVVGNSATRDERLDLRGEPESPAVIRIVERLDAIGVAGEEQGVACRVPDRERENTAYVVHHRLTLSLIEVEQNLGVGLAAEYATFGLQLHAQRSVVVDFAIEGNDVVSVSAHHGLSARDGQINN